MRKISITHVFFLTTLFLIGCQKFLIDLGNNIEFPNTLSELKIYAGNLQDLNPSSGYEKYELSSTLFTDYSQKQRLIYLPSGTKLRSLGSGLPEFPDGCIIVKTFFYWNNEAKPEKGKKILETRVLKKINNQWNVAEYQWNESMSEANLIVNGSYIDVTYTDKKEVARVIKYHLPSKIECTTCHQSSNKIEPIGPKLQNLNRQVSINGVEKKQLTHFYNMGWLDADVSNTVDSLPDWSNKTYSLEKRARAYMDVNCAHCHNPNGAASIQGLKFQYKNTLSETGITDARATIIRRIESTNAVISMPKLGTAIKHDEGIELMKAYINSL